MTIFLGFLKTLSVHKKVPDIITNGIGTNPYEKIITYDSLDLTPDNCIFLKKVSFIVIQNNKLCLTVIKKVQHFFIWL